MNDKKKKTALPGKEIAWYVIASFLALAGIVFIVIGIVGDHLPVKASENWVTLSEQAWLAWSKMGYRYWGVILLCAGALIGCTALTFFARNGDRDSERALRRAQRLAIEAEEEPMEAETTEKPASSSEESK